MIPRTDDVPAEDPTARPPVQRRPVRTSIAAIKNASVVLAAIAIVAMALIMLAEAIMRYAFSAPLGWNVSAVERILMPMSVFLALPWLYVTAGHVSAEIIYDRLPARRRMTARVVGHVLLLVIAAALAYSGLVTVVDSFVLGDAPPPGSSEVPLPSWIWQLSQPVGTAALFVVALLDTPRAIGEDRALVEETDSEESVLAAAGSDCAVSDPSPEPNTHDPSLEPNATDRDDSSGTGGDR